MFGPDFYRAISGYTYLAPSPWKLWQAILIAVALLVANAGLQTIGAFGVLFGVFQGAVTDQPLLVKSALIGVFPAALISVPLFIWVARLRNGKARDRLALRFPDLGWLGWLSLIIGFVITMFAVIALLATVLGVDMANYTPSPDGTKPHGDSAGMIESMMFELVKEPIIFWLAFLSLAIGAPLAEEFIFRGQLFAALKQSSVGGIGAVVISSAAWSILHINTSLPEPWFAIGIIFTMGLVLGWLLLRFGSLWVTIILHGVWNGFYALMALAAVNAV